MNSDTPHNLREELEARLTALLLGELSADDAALLQKFIAQDPALAALHEKLKLTVDLVRETARDPIEQPGATPEPLRLSEARRQKLLAQFKTIAPKEFAPKKQQPQIRISLVAVAAVVTIAAVLSSMLLPALSSSKSSAKSAAMLSQMRQIDVAKLQWAEENKKSANDEPTMDDLKPYLGRGSMTFSPPVAGGKYVPGKVGEPVAVEMDAEKAKGLSLFRRAQVEHNVTEIEAEGERRVRFSPNRPLESVNSWQGQTYSVTSLDGAPATAPVPARETPPASQNYVVTAGATLGGNFGAQPNSPLAAIALPSEVNGDVVLNGPINAGEASRPTLAANSGSLKLAYDSAVDEFATGTTKDDTGALRHMWGDEKSSGMKGAVFVPETARAGATEPAQLANDPARVAGIQIPEKAQLSRDIADLNQQQRSQLAANSTPAIDPATGLPLTVSAGGIVRFQNGTVSQLAEQERVSEMPTRSVGLVGGGAEETAGRGGRRGGSNRSNVSAFQNSVATAQPGAATPNSTKDQMVTRTFRVDPNNFRQGLENVSGFGLGGGSGGGGAGGFGGGGGGGIGGGNGVGGQHFVTATNSMDAMSASARNYFGALGVDLNPAQGKEVFFNDRDGTLLVRGTANDLDTVEAAVQTLNTAPPEATVKAKFTEVAPDDRNALGFDWSLGNKLQAQGGSPPAGANTASTAHSPAFSFDGSGQLTAQLPPPDGRLIDASTVRTVDKAPLLGDLPYQARLFKFEGKEEVQDRTQGVGNWEVNLGAFVQDLNKQSGVNGDSLGRSDSQITAGLRRNVVTNGMLNYAATSDVSDSFNTLNPPTVTTTSGRTTTATVESGKDAGAKSAVIQLKYASAANVLSALQDETGANVQQRSTAADQLEVRRNRSSTIALPNATTQPKIVVDNRTGNLFVFGDEATVNQVQDLVAKLDQPSQQVLIESKVLETSLNPETIRGIDWSKDLNLQAPNSRTATIDEALGEYSALTGRKVLRSPNLPNATVAVTASESAPKEERIRELDSKLALNGITIVQVGDTFVKAVPQAQAAQEAAADTTPPKPATPPPVPQPEIQTAENPFSTFSLNVSDVSFKLAGASLEKGVMPEAANIRSEEFINAFNYRDPEAAAGAPLAFAWDRARYPFAYNRDLLRFSIKTAAAGRQAGRPLNLVLVLDNSGSMERADRVQIIHEALRVLATQLQPQDTFSVVTFSRTARLRVDGKRGDEAGKVMEELSDLTPEGGTNLEEAMNLAYATALRHYLANGINRVVLLTDGAANLGDVEPETLKQKVEAHRKQGIALDCFGIGWEGYNDDLLEVLSRNGDGRYGFLNSPDEAATEFAAQLAGALKVAASDVKVQVEFNPKRVTSYRQIGYAKHQLTKEQFRDNTVDAAEIAAQEAGNALYTVESNPSGEGPIATVRVRYKVPGTTTYREQAWDVPYTGNALSLEQSGSAIRLAATASAFSEWLASNPYASEVTLDRLLGYLRGVPEECGADTRPKQLEWMIRQAKSVSGK